MGAKQSKEKKVEVVYIDEDEFDELVTIGQLEVVQDAVLTNNKQSGAEFDSDDYDTSEENYEGDDGSWERNYNTISAIFCPGTTSIVETSSRRSHRDRDDRDLSKTRRKRRPRSPRSSPSSKNTTKSTSKHKGNYTSSVAYDSPYSNNTYTTTTSTTLIDNRNFIYNINVHSSDNRTRTKTKGGQGSRSYGAGASPAEQWGNGIGSMVGGIGTAVGKGFLGVPY